MPESNRQGRRPWLSRGLGNKAKEEDVYTQWKQGQVTWKEFRDAACRYREKIHVAKAQLEFKLGRNVGKSKSFFKYIGRNKQYRNIVGPLQYGNGHLRNRDIGKAEVFNDFLASVFNTDDEPRGSQCPELEDHDCENDRIPTNPEIARDLLLQLDPYKSLGPDKIHPRILKRLAGVIAKSLSMILEQFCESGEVPADWKLANLVPVFQKGKKKDPGCYRPVSLISLPGKVVEKIILGGFEKNLKDHAVIGHSQHCFMRGKSYLSRLISFYDKVAHLAD
ncbi:hypothetical protein WISP_41051 [Willisornis vidua]|uniref:Reverse transcriptase domain-containing protein n=1 Tax=Willisornis vidua TaxID=1566151 RepID=A0ABQ9DM38_9PASS|nr:hypothetical protein WISP_41051 [Willisornis vidua]